MSSSASPKTQSKAEEPEEENENSSKKAESEILTESPKTHCKSDVLEEETEGNTCKETESSIQIQQLKNRIEELNAVNEKLRKKVKNKISLTSVNLHENVTYLEQKFTELEKTKKNLENRLIQLKRQSHGLVEALEENLHRLSVQDTELDFEVRKLKAKIPELEDTDKKQTEVINTLKCRCEDVGKYTIKELEAQIITLDQKKRELENHVRGLQNEQALLNDNLEDKKRIIFLEKAERDSELSKLRANFRRMEDIRRELKQRLENTKMNADENSGIEIENVEHVMEKMQTVSARLDELKLEKSAAEKINVMLKEKVKMLQEEFSICVNRQY